MLLCSRLTTAFGEGKVEKMNEGETVADAAVKGNPAMKEVADVPGLPRVLIIGDSISIGYRPSVREALKGKAMCIAFPTTAPILGGGEAAGAGQLAGRGKVGCDSFQFRPA